MKQKENLDRLNQIKELKDNWNGYGVQSIDNIVIKLVENIIENVHVQPEIYPTGHNSIQLQYELEDKSYLEFEVFKNKILCMRIPRRNYNKAEYEIIQPVDIRRINQIIRDFYKKERSNYD